MCFIALDHQLKFTMQAQIIATLNYILNIRIAQRKQPLILKPLKNKNPAFTGRFLDALNKNRQNLSEHRSKPNEGIS